tara:strand:+ start:1687 stop:2097 length:411 start_codon:yes stop_codon:yes gene_type:complete
LSKDYNRIAALERAIAEKYGKSTVQDFRSGWEEEKEREYLEQVRRRNDKKQSPKSSREKLKAGDVVINKRNRNFNRSRSCPVCKTYSFYMKDDLYMVRYKCCYRCYVDFAEHDEESWKEGKRPTDDYIQGILRGRK